MIAVCMTYYVRNQIVDIQPVIEWDTQLKRRAPDREELGASNTVHNIVNKIIRITIETGSFTGMCWVSFLRYLLYWWWWRCSRRKHCHLGPQYHQFEAYNLLPVYSRHSYRHICDYIHGRAQQPHQIQRVFDVHYMERYRVWPPTSCHGEHHARG